MDQDVTDVMVAADADHVQDLVVLLVLDVHRAPVVLVAMVLVLDHVELVALDSVEDVVITVLHHALLTVVLLVPERAMVVFQIQFNKIVY